MIGVFWLALIVSTCVLSTEASASQYSPVMTALGVDSDSPADLPVRTASTIDGNVVNLTDTGTLTILNFWASWCRPCQKELKELQAIEPLASADNVRILTANVGETTGTIRSYLRDQKLNLRVIGGSEGKELYQSVYDTPFTQLPGTIFITGDGTIFARRLGAIQFDTQSVRDTLGKLNH